MPKKIVVKSALAAAVAALVMVPAALAAAPLVTVQVQGKSKTLLAATNVEVPAGSITKDGAPAGKCPDDSAQGALDVATRSRWSGKWYASYKEYYITSILGTSETGKKYYWGLYVNGKLASKGACDVKLKAGDKILFKVTKS
jgi:Domain of unknown function (DUF4430)